LVNAIFSALPIFAMSTFLLPKTVIKQVDKYRKHCLWRGPDLSSKQPSKAAWQMVCTSKDNGGLGVLNLQTHNESLLLKNLHKFYNQVNIPWVHLLWACYYSNGNLPMTHVRKGSFWGRDSLKLLDQFKGMAPALVHSGSSCLFWLDVWNNHLFSHHFPHLFSFVRNQKPTVLQVVHTSNPLDLFHLPLSDEAYHEFQDLLLVLNDFHLQTEPDQWIYIWGSPIFSPKKTYKHLTGSPQVHPVFRWLWKTSCQNKRKIFFWLLLRDRLSTRQLSRRNIFLEDYNTHLFLTYPFAVCTDLSGKLGSVGPSV